MKGYLSVIDSPERIIFTADFRPVAEGVLLDILIISPGDHPDFSSTWYTLKGLTENSRKKWVLIRVGRATFQGCNYSKMAFKSQT